MRGSPGAAQSHGGEAAKDSGGTDSPLTTKGDLWGFSTTDIRVPIGSTNGMVPVVDSSEAAGWKWASPGSLTITWDGIDNPAGNAALAMAAYTTVFTWNAATGAAVNLFTLVDTAANTGTGYVFSAETAATSNAKPFRVVARGITAINTSTTGVVTLGTAGSLAGSLVLAGLTSGSITLTAANVSGSQSYTLPAAVPAANAYVLTATTAGVMSWAAPTVTLNQITSPTANKTFAMVDKKLTYSWDTQISGSFFTLSTTAVGPSSGYVIQVLSLDDTAPFHFAMSTGTSCLTSATNASGDLYVGIGTPTPASILDVVQMPPRTGVLTKALAVTGYSSISALTASTEYSDVVFDLSHTVEHATGALATQRAFVIQGPTYSFVGASTLTTAVTLDVGAPLAGANATFTNTYAITAGAAIGVTVADAATNTVSTVGTYTHTTSGTAAANYGAGILYALESAGGTTRTAARIGVSWSTATDAAEVASFRIGLMNAGAAVPASGSEQFRFGAAGNAISTGLGSVSAPVWGMGNEATGWYMTGAAQAALAVNGVKLVEIYTGYCTIIGRIYNGNDGQVGDCAYTWGADANTGMYRVTTDTLALAAGGADVIRISMVSSANRIGFFGATPVIKQTASDAATIIAALQAYGLLV